MAALTGAPGLLEHAVGYALATAALATPRLLPQATPCAGWDLRTLVLHVSDSLGVLAEALQSGRVRRRGAGAGRRARPRRVPAPPGAGAARGVRRRRAGRDAWLPSATAS